jgi:hypothetical protein
MKRRNAIWASAAVCGVTLLVAGCSGGDKTGGQTGAAGSLEATATVETPVTSAPATKPTQDPSPSPSETTEAVVHPTALKVDDRPIISTSDSTATLAAVPLDVKGLANDSSTVAVIHGFVTDTSDIFDGFSPYRQFTVAVDEVLQGEAGPVVTIAEMGGMVSCAEMVVARANSRSEDPEAALEKLTDEEKAGFSDFTFERGRHTEVGDEVIVIISPNANQETITAAYWVSAGLMGRFTYDPATGLFERSLGTPRSYLEEAYGLSLDETSLTLEEFRAKLA